MDACIWPRRFFGRLLVAAALSMFVLPHVARAQHSQAIPNPHAARQADWHATPGRVRPLVYQPLRSPIHQQVWFQQPEFDVDEAPAPPGEVGRPVFEIPMVQVDVDPIQLQDDEGSISLVVRNGSLREVITALAETQGFNVVTVGDVDAPLTISLERVRWEEAMDSILTAAGFSWFRRNNIIHIARLTDMGQLSPELNGRKVEIFHLDFAEADDVNSVVSGMLSPIGQSSVIVSEESNNRRTRELIVVEDLPVYLERIREQVAMIDLPPRQVMIEAHILEVDLSDERRHGVNWDHIFSVNGHLVEIEASGFGNPSASPSFFVNVGGSDLNGLLELLKTTTDAKTLASPKLLCLNSQTARIQIGEQLGFRVTTTTETSTTESVEFLDVGVVLEVTPRISRDDRIVMNIHPEVSSGRVSVNTGLPEEETTELDTDVLVQNNQAIIIGGLIQESDSDQQAKVPFFGELKLIGPLFMRREARKTRSEIIVALLPRIVPYEPMYAEQEAVEVSRTTTPLLHGPLHRFPRPWEPTLPDWKHNPRALVAPRAEICCDPLDDAYKASAESFPTEAVIPAIEPATMETEPRLIPLPNPKWEEWEVPPVHISRLPSIDQNTQPASFEQPQK